jgi:putative FmdB family regulatory protein
MPIYEYVCRDCNAHFEVVRPMKDADAPVPCKKCHGDHIDRMLSLFVARSGGQTITSGQSSCGGCSGGSCASCKN